MAEIATHRWFEIGISISLDNLQEFVESQERSLNAQKKQFDEWVDHQAAEIDEEHRDDFYEFHSDEHWQLSDVFPSIFRSSVFVASYSLLEHHLVNICKREHKKRKIKKAPEFKSGIIFSAKKYLEKDAGIELPDEIPAWNMICVYNELRNAIVHEAGRINEDRKKKIKDFLNASATVSLDQRDKLQFSEEFCPEVIKNMKEFFFKELLPAIPD